MRTLTARRPALDGLRGLAALVVVVHHCLLIAPSLADAYRRQSPRGPTGSWSWLATYTPLHLLWGGAEAVLVFFVLSGLVLSLPAVSGRASHWLSYYPQRMLRLYLPIIGATAFALLLALLVQRQPQATSSWWLASQVADGSIREAAVSAAVVKGTTGLNSALWSLKWEVIFSLLLPLFLLLFVRVRGWTTARVLALVAVVLASQPLDQRAFLYLPVFGFGVLMAQHMDRLDRAGERFDARRPVIRRACVAGMVLLLTARWWMRVVPGLPHPTQWRPAAILMNMLGACLVVWVFASVAGGVRIGTHPLTRWLGMRSFSLYLVHLPIVTTVAFLFGGTTNAALVLLIALPASLLAAEVFGRVCETPAHRFSQAVGRRIREHSRTTADAA